MKWMTRVLLVMCAYFGGWAAFYTVFMGIDYRYVFEYLRLAWTDPGMLPMYINIGALATAATAIVIMCLFTSKQKERAAGNEV